MFTISSPSPKTASTIKNNKWFLILEDDAVIDNKWSESYVRSRFQDIEYYLQDTPVVLLDAHVNGPQPEFHPHYPKVQIANGHCNATHAYVIQRDYLDTLIQGWNKTIPIVIKMYQDYQDGKISYQEFKSKVWIYGPDCSPWIELQKKDTWFLLESLMIQDNWGEEYESIIGDQH